MLFEKFFYNPSVIKGAKHCTFIWVYKSPTRSSPLF